MMSTTSDYVGRQFDLVIWQGIAGVAPPGSIKELTPALALPGEGGMILTGIAKMAQRATLLLLTELGSLIYTPDIGTTFMVQARQGYWRTTLDVQQAFYASLVDVKRQMAQSASPTTPTDELLSGANLLSVSLSGDHVSLSLQWVSQAGTSYTVVAPIATIVK